MSKEYKIEQSNGIWYVWQFDVCKRLTAHAKLETIRQLALWIEEQENYDNYENNTGDNERPYNNTNTGIIECYRYNSGHIIPGQ